MTLKADAFVPIPGLGEQDVALVPSILTAAGFVCHVQAQGGEVPGVVYIRTSDVPAIKQLLRDYKVGDAWGGTHSIAW